MTTLPQALQERIEAYRLDEPDDTDRAALDAMVATGELARIEAAFAEPIAFGTAGLRAEVGPGPAHMNVRNVLRATRALLETLVEQVDGARTRGIVVGHDARPSSARLAEAVILRAAEDGFVVHAYGEAIPTPLVAFAAHELGTAAAVVITASHNPPSDNGMKVYGPSAAQIVPPWDAQIAARMHDARPSPRLLSRETLQPETRARILAVPPSMIAAHRERCTALAMRDVARAPIRVAYTAMHGVGAAHVERALAALGEVELFSVAAQHRPDGTFPTTKKPNPEEPGALALVLALAAQVDACLVLATDPDADRLAVAVRHGGAFVVLHGDEIGVLLGEHLARTATVARPLVLTTIVSSPWLLAIARDLGVAAEVTLTGHKWIADRARTREAEGLSFVFGYEEAIGFAFATGVRDKDGIAASVVVARIAGELAAEGLTLIDRLQSISALHGMHRSRLVSTQFSGPSPTVRMERALDALRDVPPASLAGRAVRGIVDGRIGSVRGSDGSVRALGLPTSSLFGFELEGGLRVLLRPSGTEPKLKLYLDLATTLGDGETYLAARSRCDAELDAAAAAISAAILASAS